MCGIIGTVDYTKTIDEVSFNKMRDIIDYRGPDDFGTKLFEKDNHTVALGHRRLSIQDLSPLGHQPMCFEHLNIVFNGEVYNFHEIRVELESLNYTFDSHSDTEVILKAFHAWGVKCVDKFRGMFAFAIYDAQKEQLFIFRDRAGVKPLYFYKTEELFLFGSELKSFYQHPKFQKVINKKALPYYFRFGYIPAPLSIFENTFKLQAGHYWVVDCNTNSYVEKKYWSVEEAYQQPKLQKSETEIIDELESLLTESCELRMVSDVPVGVFLSGGVDSTLVASLLHKNAQTPLKTFTIGFEEKKYNEATFAKEIAEHLGTDHTEYYCTQDDMLAVINDLPMMYDEPFGDSSGIPTLLVSRLAKEQVSVVLSGDGGDEAFVGYSKYFALEKMVRLEASQTKKALLKTLTALMSERFVEQLNNLLPASKKQKNIKDKYQKFKNALNSDGLAAMFINASSYVDSATLEAILLDSSIDFGLTNFDVFNQISHLTPLEQMSVVDYKTYMADDVLTKVDRASMAVSLEAREPLIDHTIIEFSAQIPDAIKYHQNQGKYLLKQVLYRHIPKALIERPKSGFQVPLYEWLRDDLREQLDRYLSYENLRDSGIYNVDAVLQIKAHLYQGKSINLSLLWFILMFEMWRERWEV